MVDWLRIARYKAARLMGNSKVQSMLKAGFKESTAYDRCSDNKSVLIGEAQLKEDINNKLTPEYILRGIDKIASNGKVESNQLNAFKVLADIKGMTKQGSQSTNVNVNIDNTSDEPEELTRLSRIKLNKN